MTTLTVQRSSRFAWLGLPRSLGHAARTLLLGALDRLDSGTITVRDGDFTRTFVGRRDPGPLAVTVVVHDRSFYAAAVFGGSPGAGEAFVDGLWTCDRLTDLLRLLVLNRHVFNAIDGAFSRLLAPVNGVLHRLSRNTPSGSRRNIAAHYDLSNEFFALWLDPTMTYSCGIFEPPSATLEQASLAKLDRVCRKLALSPHDHLLEIGTGWGGLAVHASTHFGCRVTTTTISRRQAQHARERIARTGLTERVTVLEHDYRDLPRQCSRLAPQGFDKLVSIEMVEAVGAEFVPTYFSTLSALLKPSGRACLQAITVKDQHYKAALHHVDFIKKHIFPGCFIPSINVLLASVERSTDLQLTSLEDIGPHYATTLAAWRRNFLDRLDDVRALGFDDRFVRAWEYYLCYCEAGFAERHLGVAQLVLDKPASRLQPWLPALGSHP